MQGVCATSMGCHEGAEPTCCSLRRPKDAGGGGALDGDSLPFNTAYTYSAIACMDNRA